MRKLLAIVTLIILMASCRPEPVPTPEPQPAPEHTTYLPIYGYTPYPKCERSDRWGIAWLQSRNVERDMRDFCANHWYNTTGPSFNPLLPGETPHGWCDFGSDGFDFSALLRTLPDGYTGHVLSMNEPGDDPKQCKALTPAHAARIYISHRQAVPLAKMVAPNIIVQAIDGEFRSIAYLRQFIKEVEKRQGGKADFYAIGVHFYGAENIPVTTKLDWVYALMVEMGYGHLPIWVTEYGVFPAPDAGVLMSNMTYEALSHPRVERVYGYTPRGADGAINWIDARSGRLTYVGRGVFDGLKRAGLVGRN